LHRSFSFWLSSRRFFQRLLQINLQSSTTKNEILASK